MMTIAYLVVALTLLYFLVVIPSPLFVNYLVNNPDGVRPTRKWYLFTKMEPGVVKDVVNAGGDFVRSVMRHPGYVFGSDPDLQGPDAEWRVGRPTELTEITHDPIPWVNLSLYPLAFWAWWMYVTTGAIWVGVPPFRRLRETNFLRLRMQKDEQGKVLVNPATNIPMYAWFEDRTDHQRVREETLVFSVPGGNTRDQVPVAALVSLVVRVVNPYVAGYKHARTDVLISTTVMNGLNEIFRNEDFDVLFGEGSDDKKTWLAETLLNKIKVTFTEYGMELSSIQVQDYEPNPAAIDKNTPAYALIEAWVAKRHSKATVTAGEADAKVRELRGGADAKVSRQLGEVAREFPEAVDFSRQEAIRRTAEAGAGAVILNAGGAKDNDTALLLATMREMLKELRGKN